MMSISFLHIADVHLGSPLVASSEEKQKEINTAIENALMQVVSVAIENEVDFIVIAGDLFDGRITNASLAAKFVDIMSPAGVHKIHTFVLWGNHDAEGKHNLSFNDSEYLHFFNSSSPQTFTIDDKNIALHGQSFASQVVVENLAANYPSKKEGAYNIGVLHTSLDGREGHDTYAPCSLQDLKNKEYDYWALGHIHKREVVNDARPTVIYSGNLQGRHSKESDDKGCYLVKIDEQHNVTPQFIPISKIIFLRESINIDSVESEEVVVQKIREQFASNAKPAYLRLTFEGKTILSSLLETKMLETIKFELLAKNVTLAKMKNRTTYPKSIDEIAEGKNTIGSMISLLCEDSMKAEVKNIVDEEISLFKDIRDYTPDEDSLYEQLSDNSIKAVENLVLTQLQKELK